MNYPYLTDASRLIDWARQLVSSLVRQDAALETRLAAIEARTANLGGTSFTPAATPVTNASAATPASGRWSRVRDVVTVSGSLSVTPSAAGAVVVALSLPVASTTASVGSVSGVGSDGVLAAAVAGDPGAGRARISFTAPDTAARVLPYVYSYRVTA